VGSLNVFLMLATTASVRVSFRTHGVRRGLDRAYSRAHEVNIFYPPALAPKHSQASKALNRVNDIKRVKEERQTLSRPTVSKERPGGVLLSQVYITPHEPISAEVAHDYRGITLHCPHQLEIHHINFCELRKHCHRISPGCYQQRCRSILCITRLPL